MFYISYIPTLLNQDPIIQNGFSGLARHPAGIYGNTHANSIAPESGRVQNTSQEITPDPSSSSPSYQAANCPGVTALWGASKVMVTPASEN